MGLDNGIRLKLPEGKPIPKWVPRREHRPEEVDDICYWRKCWGIRSAILNVLDPEGKREAEILWGYYPIEVEDIPAIIRALKPFFSKEYWKENADSIWEFDEIFESLLDNVIKLEKLKEYLEENKDASCVFYDSY